MPAQAADFRAGSVEPRCGSLAAASAACATGRSRWRWAELRKLRHDHVDIVTRSVQPLLWLFIFGTALRRNRALAGGFHDYRAYLAPGVMAQAALFVAIFFGLAVIWERDVGQLQRLLATPLPRLAIVLGKATGAGDPRAHAGDRAAGRDRDRGHLDPLERARASPARSSCSLLGTGGLRLPVDDPRRARAHARALHGHRPAVMMPLFFASSALYPLSIMPAWLRIARARQPAHATRCTGCASCCSASRPAARSGSTSP